MEARKTECFTSADCRNKHQSYIWRSRSMNRNSEIMELGKTGCFASARCGHKHQSWSCETLDALQVLTVTAIINHGAANQQHALVLTVATSISHRAAKRWMLYKCSLSRQASIQELRTNGWLTNADCRNKQLDDLQVARVGVRVRVGVGVEKNWMLYHCSQ